MLSIRPATRRATKVVVLLLSLSLLFGLCSSLFHDDAQHLEQTETTVQEDEFIVFFDGFEEETVLEKTIKESELKTNCSWEVVHRHNAALNYPTDFLLLKIDETNKTRLSQLLTEIEALDHVRYITPNLKYHFTKKLYSYPAAPRFSKSLLSPISPVDPTSLSGDDEEESCRSPHLVFSHDFHEPHTNSSHPHHNHRGAPDDLSFEEDMANHFASSWQERSLHATTSQMPETNVPTMLNADFLWDKQVTGVGVKVAIFDTGTSPNNPYFKNIAEITDWTDEDSFDDTKGHGTFVAGLIASSQPDCMGLAPDASLYIFRVFTASEVSYTSWFLDAFNYAIHTGIDVLNLSTGGPDYLDRPFVEKIWEMSANKITIISAIGNSGPLFGTLSNPADMADVIGVGGINSMGKLASFSSRGMTTWELPHGYGRVKPDILAFANNVLGLNSKLGCTHQTGTSFASPVVAGSVALLISAVPEGRRAKIINPASIKQVLIESSELLPGTNIFSQGAGQLNLLSAYELLNNYEPRASLFPSELNLTDCPYMWPYCETPLYATSMPLIVNTTILNGMGVTGRITEGPTWSAISFTPHESLHQPSDLADKDILQVVFSHSDVLWPWSGFLAIFFRVNPRATNHHGIVEGVIRLTVTSPGAIGEKTKRQTSLELPVRIQVIPTPPREKRLLWDQYHQLNYPQGYFPRDIVPSLVDPFDWNADHLHTNFRQLFQHVLSLGYFIETLGESFNCFDASNYGTLLLFDPEAEFLEDEVTKLRSDILDKGLSVIVAADWHNTDMIDGIKLLDKNTQKQWQPMTGGSNVPAINTLLDDFGISFSSQVVQGSFRLEKSEGFYGSGSTLSRFPAGGLTITAHLDDQVVKYLKSINVQVPVEIIGLVNASSAFLSPLNKNKEKNEDALSQRALPNSIPVVQETNADVSVKEHPKAGRIAVIGDSSCFDDSSKVESCMWLLDDLLAFAAQGVVSDRFLSYSRKLSSNLDKQRHSFSERSEPLLFPPSPECSAIQFQPLPDADAQSGDPISWKPLVYQQINLQGVFEPRITQIQTDYFSFFSSLSDVLLGANVLPYIVIIAFVSIAFRLKKRRQQGDFNAHQLFLS